MCVFVTLSNRLLLSLGTRNKLTSLVEWKCLNEKWGKNWKNRKRKTAQFRCQSRIDRFFPNSGVTATRKNKTKRNKITVLRTKSLPSVRFMRDSLRTFNDALFDKKKKIL